MIKKYLLGELRMTRIKLILFTIICSLLCSCSSSKGKTTIEIFETDSGITINFFLAQPRSSIHFNEPGYINPSAKIKSSSGRIENGYLKFENPKSEFQLSIELDAKEENSVYPLLTKVSQNSYVLYAPPVFPNDQFSSIVYTNLAGTQTKFQKSHNLDGYLFLGANPEISENFDWVRGASLSDEFNQELFTFTDEILTYYSEKMSNLKNYKPLIIVSSKTSEKSFNRGDTTKNGVIFLRYHFPVNKEPEKKLTSLSKDFIAHELFHLWTPKAAEKSSNWWIHEGAAEYASWLATSSLSESDLLIKEKIEKAFNNCSNMLRHLSIEDAIGSIKNASRYTCGAFMNWLATDSYKKSNGKTEFHFWRELWKNPQEELELRTKLNRILETTNNNILDTIDIIVSGHGTKRWDKVLNQFNKQGAEFDKKTPPIFSLQIAATQALVLSACGELFGVGINEENRLYAISSCDPFKSSPVIISVDGIDPIIETQKYIDYTTEACIKNEEVNMVLLDGEEEIPFSKICNTAVQQPPTQIKLNRL